MNSRFMQDALAEARLAAAEGEVPIGAVVVLNGEIISSAHNRCEQDKDPTAHAELLAIKAAAKAIGDFRLTGAELYVTLEPCPMCAGAAANARIGEVIFGAFDPVKGALESVSSLYTFPFPNRPQVYGGIKEKECLALLRDFFKKIR